MGMDAWLLLEARFTVGWDSQAEAQRAAMYNRFSRAHRTGYVPHVTGANVV